MASRSFEDVEVWQRAHRWVLEIYRYSESFPKHEMFGLSSQLRRAAVSIPANFAEGFKKRGLLISSVFITLLKAQWKNAVTI